MIEKFNLNSDYFNAKIDTNCSKRKMSIYKENRDKNEYVLLNDERFWQKGGRQLSFENTHENMTHLFEMPIIFW